MRLQQLCVYVCRLDDIRSHMRTQFAALTLRSVTIKYEICENTHTHALVTPLSVFVLVFNAVFILLSLHIQQHTVHHSQLPPPFDCLPPYFPSLPATSDCAVVQVSIKFISMCPFECSELNPPKPPHFNQTDKRAYLRKKCGQQLVDGDKRALG